MIFYVKLPATPEVDLDYCSVYGNGTEGNCRDEESMIPDSPAHLRNLQEIVKQLQDFNKGLWEDFKPQQQHKRGMIDIIGDIGHAVFGLATDDQLEQVYRDMRELQSQMAKQQDANAGFGEEMQEIVRIQEQKFEGVFHELDLHKAAISGMNKNIASIHTSLQEITTSRNLHIIHTREEFRKVNKELFYVAAGRYLSNLRDQADHWRHNYQLLQEGKMPRHLISLKQFHDALKKLHEEVVKKDQRMFVPHHEQFLPSLYEGLRTNTRLIGDHLLIAVSVPILTLPHLFRAYQVKATPVAIGLEQGYSQAVVEGDTLLVSTNNEFYSIRSNTHESNCVGANVMFCMDMRDVRHVTYEHCLIDSFRAAGTPQEVSTCEFTIHNAPMPSLIVPLQGGRLLMVNESRFQHVSCPLNNSVHELPTNLVYELTVPCACLLTGSEVKSYMSAQDCELELEPMILESQSQTMEPVMRSVKEFQELEGMQNLTRNEALEQMLAAAADRKAEGQDQQPRLDELFKAIQHREALVRDPLERREKGRAHANIPGWEVLGSYVASAALAILCGAAIYKIHRRQRYLKKLVTAIMLERAGNASANPTEQVPGIEGGELEMRLLMWLGLTLMLLYLVMRAIVWGYSNRRRILDCLPRYCQRWCRAVTHHDKLNIYIKFHGRKETATVFLTTLDYERSDTTLWYIPKCTKAYMGVKHERLLTLRWNRAGEYEVNNIPKRFVLPRKITVDRETARVIKHMVANSPTMPPRHEIVALDRTGYHTISTARQGEVAPPCVTSENYGDSAGDDNYHTTTHPSGGSRNYESDAQAEAHRTNTPSGGRILNYSDDVTELVTSPAENSETGEVREDE